LTGIDGDTYAFVTVEFDGFDFIATDANRLPKTFRNIDLGSRCALFPGMFEHVLSQLLQGGKGIGKAGNFRHEWGVRAGKSLS
jgi:hypothetical protein